MRGRPQIRPFPALTGPGRRARWRRSVIRKALAAGLVLLAVPLLLDVVRPPAPRQRSVVIAARDLAAGTRLSPQHLRRGAMPAAFVPPGALDDRGAVAGRVLSAPMADGEVLTATRLVPQQGDGAALDATAGATAGSDGSAVALHVVAADVRSLDLTPPGSRVAVYPHTGGRAMARDVLVVTVDPPPAAPADGVVGSVGGEQVPRGLVLAVPTSTAEAILAAPRPEGGPPVVLVVPHSGASR